MITCGPTRSVLSAHVVVVVGLVVVLVVGAAVVSVMVVAMLVADCDFDSVTVVVIVTAIVL